MRSSDYPEGYWERGEGSNYRDYGDDPGWLGIVRVMGKFGFGPGTVVIEAGASKGWFIRRARLGGLEAKGFDISEYAVSHPAPGVEPYLTAHNAGLEWPYQSESADVVCAWEFFEHVYDDEILFVLSEMLRVLKKGGELWLKIGIDVPADHPFAGQPDHDQTHVAIHDREWWESLFEMAGLEHLPDREAALDAAFADRDWQGRFFVWRKP